MLKHVRYICLFIFWIFVHLFCVGSCWFVCFCIISVYVVPELYTLELKDLGNGQLLSAVQRW